MSVPVVANGDLFSVEDVNMVVKSAHVDGEVSFFTVTFHLPYAGVHVFVSIGVVF